jgi:Fe-S cluster assembly protein SufD
MSELALPTRKDEAYRYSDLEALARVWPPPRETIVVAAGQHDARTLVHDAGTGPASGGASVVRDIEIILEPGAALDLHILNAGNAFGRIALEVTLGEAARFHLGAAQLGAGAETLEIVTEVTHAAPNAVSRQVIRSVLAGTATGSYLGRVAVARGADGTDAEQSVRALLLDRTATANARPELEIFADDVKCAHGCAVGELDRNGLFYLQSRGLPPPEAKRLMIQAFVAEAFVGAAEAEALTATALARLETML